jgi:NAD(P)-dependent dehydrogenase (short-subunit alcohol dehydrogenase family)
VQADESVGRLDLLVNNARGVHSGRCVEQSERSWRSHIDINLVSMLAGTSATVPLMIRGGRGGSIMNVSSIEGTRAGPTFVVDVCAMPGLVSLTRTMPFELADHGIRVNANNPDQTITLSNHGQRSGPIDERLSNSAACANKLNLLDPFRWEGEGWSKSAGLQRRSIARRWPRPRLSSAGGRWNLASSVWSRNADGFELGNSGSVDGSARVSSGTTVSIPRRCKPGSFAQARATTMAAKPGHHPSVVRRGIERNEPRLRQMCAH